MPTTIREGFGALVGELLDPSCPNTQELYRCERAAAAALVDAARALADESPSQERARARASLQQLTQRAHAEMAAAGKASRGWRRLYTDASILLAFADVLEFKASARTTDALSAISFLDHAIVIAGAPGDGRIDLIFDLIENIQSNCLDSSTVERGQAFSASSSIAAPVLSAANSVPILDTPPSLISFASRLSRRPFVLKGFLSDWPALNEHPWRSVDYLRAVAGPGRIVPVEVGSDYRSDDWTQTLMPWDDFLSSLEERHTDATPKPVLYLAQHSLFNQLPALKDDIILPDYVYSELAPPESYPQYTPPANEERLVLNAWLGPKGTVSPAHTDPFFNFYAQVVGRKTIWLAPPSPHMYPYPRQPSASSADSQEPSQPRNPAANAESPSMSNTTQVDVLLTSEEEVATSKVVFPDFWEHVVPAAMTVTLEPGDLLFFPPGWWHAMRSEETSFSVSMWF